MERYAVALTPFNYFTMESEKMSTTNKKNNSNSGDLMKVLIKLSKLNDEQLEWAIAQMQQLGFCPHD